MGIVTEDVFAGGAGYRRCTLSQQAQAGVKIIRQTFHWSQIETSRGRYDFGYYDGYMASLASHRIRVLPILFTPPAFHSSAPRRGARRGTYPPRSYAAMGRFAAAVARRYGPRGSFWRQNRGVPKLAIRSWQVRNEPNLRAYWPRGANARQYTQLLRTVGRAIKRVDRRAEIVTAGLPESRIGVPLKKYLTGMYRAGARSAFDTLAINPYARSASGVIRVVASARGIMRRSGDRRGRIWVTEVGWSTDGPRSSFRVGESGQATRIRGTLKGLHRARRRLGVRGVVYYNWRDSPPYAGGKDFWGLHTGLFDINGRSKPGFTAFRRTAPGLR